MDSLQPTSKTPENNTITEQNPTKTPGNPLEAITKTDNRITQNNTENIKILKTKEYRIFTDLCRRGDYISARITAKSLGVDPHTIIKWSNTKTVRKALEESIRTHVQGMAKYGQKDWRMHDKMLDRIEDSNNKDKTEQSINLTNLIQINT